jgi:hypothetical protein
MKRHKKSALFLALSLFSPGSAAFAQQAVDPLLAKLNALPPHERHAALVKGAQSERSVEWYATLPADHSKSILDAFRKHYPFIEVTQTRAGGGRLVNRVATEHRAGLNKFDVLGGTSTSHVALMKAGLVARNMSPVRFADFLFTREAQEIFARQNRLPARRDLEWRFAQKTPERIHVLSVDKWAPRYSELISTFDKIFR